MALSPGPFVTGGARGEEGKQTGTKLCLGGSAPLFQAPETLATPHGTREASEEEKQTEKKGSEQKTGSKAQEESEEAPRRVPPQWIPPRREG